MPPAVSEAARGEGHPIGRMPSVLARPGNQDGAGERTGFWMATTEITNDHYERFENGLLTIGGGKLTTFRLMARQAIKLLRKNIPGLQFKKTISTTSTSVDPPLLSEAPIDQKTKIRLAGRYGLEAAERITNSDPSELTSIGSSPNLWAEIRWAARAEGIVHLEDLLLRRVRLGILLPAGGIEVIGKIKKIVKEELGWNENRWEMEFRNYKLLLERSYSKKLS